jgi:hypothetical protein
MAKHYDKQFKLDAKTADRKPAQQKQAVDGKDMQYL